MSLAIARTSPSLRRIGLQRQRWWYDSFGSRTFSSDNRSKGGSNSGISNSNNNCKSNNNDSSKSSKEICKRLGIIGGGRMAEALIHALDKNGAQSSKNIVVFDVNAERISYLKKKYNIISADTVQKLADECDVVFLAVKPQHVGLVADMLKEPIKGLLVSIVAGCTIKKLTNKFHTSNIIRSMPNTPSMVLEGMTVWTATSSTSAHMVSQARELLGSLGEQIEVTDENYLDMATAVSGSGPAYIFLAMEAMVDAAVHLGFPRDTALRLVAATIKGSASYAIQSPENLATLRNNVTSPGGTTASALYQFERGRFRTVVADAIWAAYNKSKELGSDDSDKEKGDKNSKVK